MVGAMDGQGGRRFKLDAALGTIVSFLKGYLGLFFGGGAGRALRLLLPASVTCSVQQRAAVHAQPLSSPACSLAITVGWVLGPQHTHHWPPPFPPVLRAAGGPAARTGQSDSNTSYEQFRAARASPPPPSHAVSQCLRLTVSLRSHLTATSLCVQSEETGGRWVLTRRRRGARRADQCSETLGQEPCPALDTRTVEPLPRAAGSLPPSLQPTNPPPKDTKNSKMQVGPKSSRVKQSLTEICWTAPTLPVSRPPMMGLGAWVRCKGSGRPGQRLQDPVN